MAGLMLHWEMLLMSAERLSISVSSVEAITAGSFRCGGTRVTSVKEVYQYLMQFVSRCQFLLYFPPAMRHLMTDEAFETLSDASNVAKKTKLEEAMLIKLCFCSALTLQVVLYLYEDSMIPDKRDEILKYGHG